MEWEVDPDVNIDKIKFISASVDVSVWKFIKKIEVENDIWIQIDFYIFDWW